MATVDTSNYFAAAVSDEQENASPVASGSNTPAVPEDKASKKARRDQRIAEAVQRSKVEYTAENVYTERGWFMHERDRGIQKSKIDQQRLEFLTSALYYSSDVNHHDILDKVLEVFDDDIKGGLPKELLDIGIRSAMKAARHQDAVKLARSGKSSTQWAGAACTAHDAFLAAGEYDESLAPLIMCMSIGGPQYPLLTRLSAALTRDSPQSESQLSLFVSKLDDLIAKRESSATRPLSHTASDDGNARRIIQDRGTIDIKELYEEISHVGYEVEVLAEAVRRLEKESKGGAEVTSNERGVRQL